MGYVLRKQDVPRKELCIFFQLKHGIGLYTVIVLILRRVFSLLLSNSDIVPGNEVTM